VSRSLPSWVGRTAAVALLLGVFGLAYLYVISPVLDAYQGTDEEIAEARDMLERYETLAHNSAAYQSRLDKLNSQHSGTGVYLSGTTDALAAAELQNRVKGAVSAHAGRLRSIQNLPAKSDGDFLRVAVRVQFEANMASLHRILYGLEAAKPYLFVDNLDMRNRRARRRNTPVDFDPPLTIRFDLSGYLRPEAIQ